MSDLHAALAGAREALEPPWDEARAERARAGLRARGRKRAALRAVPAGVGVALLGALLAVRVGKSPPRAESVLGEEGVAARALGEGSELRVAERSASALTVDLTRGSASFRVGRRGARVFRVRAGSVHVQVLGTEFVVARAGDRGAHVRVAEGRVRVFWEGRYEDLGAGESGEFPRDFTAPSGAPVTPATEPTAEARGAEPPRGAPIAPSAGVARPSLEALFADAERALRAGSTDVAERLLRAYLSRAPRGDEAQLAAQRLGGLLLERDPRAAAETFERAYAMVPRGSAAEDALRGATDAWVRLGDERSARETAARYVRQFPTGTHLRRMRALLTTAP